MSLSLAVESRATRPRSLRNQLRHEGLVPGVVNGYKVESTPISVKESDVSKAIREHGINAVFTLTIDGQAVNTLVHKIQTDTFTKKLTHIEFLSVNMNEVTEVDAEVVLVGEAAGIKVGGLLHQNLYNVIVSATPDNLPERVEVDVTNLNIGDSLTIADLPAHPDYEIITSEIEQIVIMEEPVSAEELAEDEEAAE